MKCLKCGQELSSDMLTSGMCFNCGFSVEATVKDYNEKELAEQQEIAKKRALIKRPSHLLTTGFSFETFDITKYVGLVSGESVIGTGFISTFESNLSDILGVESSAYSDKIKKAKSIALDDMIKESIAKGGNAIIGISYEIIVFRKDIIGVSVDGTYVIVKEQHNE